MGDENKVEQQKFFSQEFHRELYKMEHERVFGALFENGQAATKAVITLNGAAAIALLAFLGHVVSEADQDALPFALALLDSLRLFCLGTAGGAFIAGMGWIGQTLFVRAAWAERFDKSRTGWDIAGNAAMLVTVAIFLASMGAFIWGGWIAARGIDTALVALETLSK